MTARRSDDEDVDDFGGPPRRHSHRFSDELLEDTRRVFQKRTDRKLSLEDARQMLENLTGFFAILHEWDRAQVRRENEEAAEAVIPGRSDDQPF